MSFLKRIFTSKKETDPDSAGADNSMLLAVMEKHAAEQSPESYKQLIETIEAGEFTLLCSCHPDTGRLLFFSVREKNVVYVFTDESSAQQWSEQLSYPLAWLITPAAEAFGLCREHGLDMLVINQGQPSCVVIDTRVPERKDVVAKGTGYRIAPARSPLPRPLSEALLPAFLQFPAVAEVYHVVIVMEDEAQITGIAIRLDPGKEQEQETVREGVWQVIQQYIGQAAGLLFLEDPAFYEKVQALPGSLFYQR